MGANGLQTWEQIALGAIVVAVLFFMVPRIKGAMARSEGQPKDWKGVLIPIGLVVLFVVFLVSLV